MNEYITRNRVQEAAMDALYGSPRIDEIEFKKDPQEVIDEILTRYGVIDLREMSDKALARGDEMLAQSKTKITVTSHGEREYIRWWKIDSDGNHYEVRRFENFVFCSCLDFFFGKTCCKHIAVSTAAYCLDCHIFPVNDHGTICDRCTPGTLLQIGDTFKVLCRSYKKTSIFRVESIKREENMCLDLNDPPATAQRPSIIYNFGVVSLDRLRRQNLIKFITTKTDKGE